MMGFPVGEVHYRLSATPNTLPLALRAFARMVDDWGTEAEKAWAASFLEALRADPQPTFAEIVRLATRPHGQLVQFFLHQGYMWQLRIWSPAQEEWVSISHSCPDERHPSGVPWVGVITSAPFVRHPPRRDSFDDPE